MSRITLIGIDPGLVHTGAVAMNIDVDGWGVSPQVLPGGDHLAVRDFVVSAHYSGWKTHVWVEQYRERGQVYSTNTAMRDLEQSIKRTVPGAKLLDNTGVKKVITDDLMKLLDVWQFGIKTHHQDLRSAARIALYGAVKDEELNLLLTRVVMRRLGLEVPR